MSSLDLYITNTETIYPGYDDPFSDVAVRLYGRTQAGEAKRVTVTGFEPYFYIREQDVTVLSKSEHDDIEDIVPTDIIPFEDRFAHLTPGLSARKLAKVVVSHPAAIHGLQEQYDITWGADVLFTNRFRIDRGIRSGARIEVGDPEGNDFIVSEADVEPVEMFDVDPRTVVFDIETDDRDSGFPDPGDARILSIVAYDTYDEEYVGFIDMDGQSLGEKFDVDPELLRRHADEDDEFELSLEEHLGLEEVDRLNFERTERRMLISFASWVSDRDPDLIGGWNSGDENADGFDLPHLIERMKEVGANPDRLSREGYIDCEEYGGDWTVEIAGRTTYDLMDAWASTKFTEPDSKKLDRVAEDKLDDAKIEHPDMGYYEMYDEDPTLFLNYNGKDTRLTAEIAETESVFGFKKRLKDMVGVDWHEVRENNDFVSMSVRRKCHEYDLSMVTARDNPKVKEAAKSDDDVNYEGAYVFPAFSGVKRNIVGVDLASLYPMTQWMLNASPDTKIDRKTAWQHDIPHVVAENGVAFRTDVDSIIRELVDEYDEIKMSYKRQRNAAEPGTEERAALALFYGVAKTIYNSFYGYTGWDKSPIYDPDIAAAVTLTGQVVIRRTAEYIESETEGSVEYGDTDSNYAQFPPEWGQQRTLEYAEQVCETLTNEVYPALCEEFLIDPANNRWEIELEMRAERMFMHGKKKHYVYDKHWEEGMDFDAVVNDGDGKVDITGYAVVKSNFAAITKQTMKKVLTAIVKGADKTEVADIVFEAASSIDASDPDWETLGMPQGLGKKLDPRRADSDDYYSWSTTRDTPRDAHPRGTWFANHLLDVQFDKGDKPKRAYLKETMVCGEEPVDVICYDYEQDLDAVADEVKMDVAKMQRKTLTNPLEPILSAFDLEPEAAMRGEAQTQAGLGAFM